MSETFPDRNLPEDIAPTVNGLRYEAYICLRNGNYNRAEKLYLKELELINNKENQRKESIHKGATYYNLGISKLFQKERTEALKYIFQAYIEDLFNTPYSKEDGADTAPAYNTLLKFFSLKKEVFKGIKSQIKNFKKDFEKWKRADSTKIVKRFFDEITQQAKKLPIITKPTPDMVKDKGHLPDKKYSVFIGGPFKIAAYLRELRKRFLKVRPKYIPYMSLDFTIKDEHTHDACMEILSNCGHAIFDVSTEAGQYAEIEHARMKKIPSLLVFSAIEEKDKESIPVPAMIRTIGFPIRGFRYLDELEDIFREFLPDRP